jgi:hypothetical protein
MLWIRRHRRRGLFVFILLVVLLALGAIAAFLYSTNTSLLRSNEQASTETTTQQTTAVSSTTATTQPESTTATAAVPEKTAATTIASHMGWVSAIGDSVMLGAVEALQQKMPNLGLLNAQGSRQPAAAIDILRQWRTAGYLGDTVVIAIGNNGPISSEQFDEMMGVLAGVPKVLIVTVTVPPSVQQAPIAVSNNTVLIDGAQRYPNTVLVDWRTASANHPEYFWGDGTHLTLQGAQAYAELIASQLGQEEGSGAPPGPQETISWGAGGFLGKCVGPRSWCVDTTGS